MTRPQITPNHVYGQRRFRLTNFVELVPVDDVLVQDKDGSGQLGVSSVTVGNDLVWRLRLDLANDGPGHVELDAATQRQVLEQRYVYRMNRAIVVGPRRIAQNGKLAVPVTRGQQQRGTRQQKQSVRQSGLESLPAG